MIKFDQWKGSLMPEDAVRIVGQRCMVCPAKADCWESQGEKWNRYSECKEAFRKWALTEVVYHDD